MTSYGTHIQDLKTDFRCHGHAISEIDQKFTIHKLYLRLSFLICEHDPSTFDKLLNTALDFIGYDRIMHISNLGKAGLCLYMTDFNKHTVC